MSTKTKILIFTLSFLLIISISIICFLGYKVYQQNNQSEETTIVEKEFEKKENIDAELSNQEQIIDKFENKNEVNEPISKEDGESENSSSMYTSKDQLVITEFENVENDIVESLSYENDSTLEKAKGVFITIVDFIFYDGEIKGVTFDELSDKGKEKVLNIAHSIDEKIESKYPNYKSTISTKATNAFERASEIIKNGTTSFSEFSKEKLGEENFNSIIEAKDELLEYTDKALFVIKEKGGNFIESVKDKISSWYENFRE